MELRGGRRVLSHPDRTVDYSIQLLQERLPVVHGSNVVMLTTLHQCLLRAMFYIIQNMRQAFIPKN